MEQVRDGAKSCYADFQAPTLETISHTMSSSADVDPATRVLVSAAQQKFVDVRTRIAVLPARSPPCHQFPLAFTFHPRA